MMPMMGMSEVWGSMGSALVTIMVLWATFDKYCPYEFRGYFKKYATKLRSLVYPYIHITFHEFSSDGFEGSKAYRAIERYLSVNSSAQAKRLKAEDIKDSQTLVLSMDYHEEVTDEFRGIKLWWVSGMDVPNRQTISFSGRGGDEAKKYFTLKFHKKYRELVTGAYLKHVLDEGKAITVKDRQRKLYTNLKNDEGYYGRRSMWTHVVFEHPATFDTLAMDPKKKREIMDDLVAFSKSKDYYAKIGKAWKRGYLLYGPPGTGKSSMVAAMANFLGYDVYDLELTAVKDNTTLRKLLIDTSSKSIIVIEDIDCSLDLTGQREGQKKENSGDGKDDGGKDPLKKEMERKMEEKKSEVTLSGLLNFIDGLWSAIGGERLIVFTTNFKEKLDPALIRRGRMDKHIELSYCGFEAFKVLAKNYLGIETHELCPTIGRLLSETDMTPADVAENLMPKAAEDDETTCLEKLVEALKKAKEDARLKAEEEERVKAEREKEEEEKRKAAAEETMAAAKEVKENGHVTMKND